MNTIKRGYSEKQPGHSDKNSNFQAIASILDVRKKLEK
jgi:hypothetical protein